MGDDNEVRGLITFQSMLWFVGTAAQCIPSVGDDTTILEFLQTILDVFRAFQVLNPDITVQTTMKEFVNYLEETLEDINAPDEQDIPG